MAYISIYVTIDTKEAAQRIVKSLLQKRLVACANIFSPHTALYWWDNEIQQDEEFAFILKTREDLFSEVKDAITSMHPYECPCIVAYPIIQGHNPFLKFIEIETDELSRPA